MSVINKDQFGLMKWAFLAQSDHSYRPVLCGAYFQFGIDTITIDCTDGYRMHRVTIIAKISEDLQNKNYLINVTELNKRLDLKTISSITDIEVKEDHLLFSHRIQGRNKTTKAYLIAGRFPDVDCVIPRNNNAGIEFSKSDIGNLSELHTITFVFCGTYAEVYTKLGTIELSGKITIEEKSKTPFGINEKLSINPRYLYDAMLSPLETVWINKPTDPVMIKDDQRIAVIMPTLNDK